MNDRKRTKRLIALGVAAAVVVAAGAGFWVWHEQPSFCNAICHTPMDPYVEDYYADDATLLAASHRVADVSCLDCHVPTLSEQLAEGVIYAHARGRKVYLTMNTLPTNEEADRLPEAIKAAATAGVDAFIVADLGVLEACKQFAPEDRCPHVHPRPASPTGPLRVPLTTWVQSVWCLLVR